MKQNNFLLIGHITRDIAPNGIFIPGGPVTYVGKTLADRGMNVTILTQAAHNDPLLDYIRGFNMNVINMSSADNEKTTTYTNMYDELQNRTQYVSEVAPSFTHKQLPNILEHAEGKRTLILPVANEIPALFYEPLSTSAEQLITAPQGSLRRWTDNGKVYHEPFSEEFINALSFADIITLSEEDIEGFDEVSTNKILFQENGTVFLTNGRDGARMFTHNEEIDIPPFQLDYETEEKNGFPTGNGDHWTAITALESPSPFDQYTDPSQYRENMYTAAVKASFLTALKIMKREGVEDGIGSIRSLDEIELWTKRHLPRVYSYAYECNIDPTIFTKSDYIREGRLNHFSRR